MTAGLNENFYPYCRRVCTHIHTRAQSNRHAAPPPPPPLLLLLLLLRQAMAASPLMRDAVHTAMRPLSAPSLSRPVSTAEV